MDLNTTVRIAIQWLPINEYKNTRNFAKHITSPSRYQEDKISRAVFSKDVQDIVKYTNELQKSCHTEDEASCSTGCVNTPVVSSSSTERLYPSCWGLLNHNTIR